MDSISENKKLTMSNAAKSSKGIKMLAGFIHRKVIFPNTELHIH